MSTTPARADHAAPGAFTATAWDWIIAGALGGAGAGGLDAGTAIARGIGGLGVARAVHLLVLAASVLAAAGVLAGALVAALGVALRLRGASGITLARSEAGLTALLASPAVVFVAFALFTGPKASRVPAHTALSICLALLGTTAIFALVRVYGITLMAARLTRAARLAAAPASGGALAPATAVALFLAAIGTHAANVTVLPRLYPWFHASAALVAFVLALMAVRLVVALAPRGRSRRRRLAGALVFATLVGVAFSLHALAGSQVLRFAAHERTAMTSLALRAVPTSLRSHTAAGAERQVAEMDLPPLPDGPRRPEADVLLITIDALRADHVGAYGYTRVTTPHIDRLAAGGVRFARAYSQAPHTSFSVASMLTGKYFPTLARLAPGEIHEPIAAVLRTYGWRTAAFYPPAVFYVDAAKTKMYAATNFSFEYVKFEYIDAQRRVDQVLDYYDTVKPQRSFVWIHFFEPHEPYEAHAGFAFGAGDMDRYDSEIAYTDAAVGRLVAEARTRRPGTIVVVAADHGEEFDEHGGRYHGSTLYEEQLHVPLIVSVPGVAPGVVSDQVELIDVTPTVLNLLDIPVPARMRGTDLGPWLATPPAPAARLPPAFAEVEDRRMVVWRDEKLICDLHWGFCAYYDLANDPRETRNLAEEKPERAAFMRALLDHWLDGHVRLEPLLARGASNPEGGPVPKAIERGRLGDLLAAPELGALMISGGPLAQRREAAQLLVGLPPRRETAAALARAAADADPIIANWAAVGAVRIGDVGARARVRSLVGADGPVAAPDLRVRAALALAGVGDPSGVPVLADALDHCEDVLLCRLIILSLGQLRDARAVPALLAHLPEVQNRREMVDALGEIGDVAARDALVERLKRDEYVPVRVRAAVALARIGDAAAVVALEHAARHDTEPTVVAAAREATATIEARQRHP
ncbi:MAG TPA: sulfatase-like hydrolase/transferase [Polyangia bacterium]|jgi:arylsulfatase A-like enzyme|nr:sulfatase-like hydrolase/transferase [Polyangia bacterium]